MTERVTKRVSKWDVQEVPEKFPTGTRHDQALLETSIENSHHNGLKQESNSPKNTARHTNWSNTSLDSAIKSEDNSKWPCMQPPSANIAGHKDANVTREGGFSQNMKTRDGNEIYSRNTSPVRDGWRSRSRSRSPKRGWNKAHRSRSWSRSWSRSRSRSRSWSRSRSRSRSPPLGPRNRSRSPRRGPMDSSESPPHGFVRNPIGWNDRIRGRSASLCNEFARGRCRRGSQCRFLHEETNRYEASRHSGSVPCENKVSRHERGGSFGNPNTEDQGYSRDKVSHGHNSQTNRSLGRCINFLKGNCDRGSSCKFIHENTMGDDHGTKERTGGNLTQSYPEHGHMREPYRINKPCRYFLMGNCRKGNSCRFSHSGAVHDRSEGGSNTGNVDKLWDGPKWSDEGISMNYGPGHIANNTSDGQVWHQKTWNDNEVADARSIDNGWGQNLGHETKSLGSSNWGNEVANSANVSAEGWSTNDGRGHVLQSGWDNLTYYKPSLGPKWNNEAADDRPRGRLEDERQDHNIGDVNKSMADSNRGYEVTGSVIDSVKDKSVNDARGCRTNQPIPPTWNDEVADSQMDNCPQWEENGRSGQVGNGVEHKSVGGTTWSNNVPDSKITNAWEMRHGMADSTGYSVDNQNKRWGVATLSDNPSDQAVQRSAPWINDGNSASIGVQLPEAHGKLPAFKNSPSVRAEGDHCHDIRNSEKPGSAIQDPPSMSYDTMFSQEQCNQQVSGQWNHPSAAGYPEGQQCPVSTVMTHPEASNMNSQIQQTVPPPAPNLNEPIKRVTSPNRPSLFEMVEKIKAGKIDPNITPPITSEASVTGNIVTSEQVAQLSHLSASLAQIFGNSQQLPQLYTTLNPISQTPVAPFLNSIQVGTPVSGSIESSQISTHPPGFSKDPINQNNIADYNSQTPGQTRVLPSVTAGIAVNNPIIEDNSEKTLHQQNNDAKQLHSVGNDRVVDHAPAHSGDANADEHMEEDKKCKDGKGMRMFKIALVGFVKEVLKPTWREGQLTKEAHKTIVKKVVDKVTSSVDPIPPTQSKIDQYLVYSKTKLTKLVEAYLEKYVKS